MKKKILVTTSNRADYGILRHLLEKIQKSKKLELFLVVTGSHLSKKYGLTINEIKKDGFEIFSTMSMIPKNDILYFTSQTLGEGVIGFSKIFNKLKPDANVVFGDRDEMLASALAAYHMNIPNIHIAGGDISGGIDEYNRHAITKISNIHFPATKKSMMRIIKMGEEPKNVILTGSLSIDELANNKVTPKKVLESKYNLHFTGNEILLVYHSVTTDKEKSEKHILNILKAVAKLKKTTISMAPNSDAGNKKIFEALRKYSRKYEFIRIHRNLPRQDYLGMLKNCAVLIGNSSSGMIEASHFNIPVINIGIRQKNRERGENVFDIKDDSYKSIYNTIFQILQTKNFLNNTKSSIFGSGNAADKIVQHLERIKLDKELIQKQICY